MKKRIFAMILAVAMLTSVMVAPVYAEHSGSVTALADTCPCGCGKALKDVRWEPYSGEASTGHYYLNGDFTQATEQTVISGNSMVLDLRGNTITTEGRNRLFLVSGYLGVLDTVGGGRLSARTPSATGEYGGVVRVVDNETTGSTFELFSGTVTPASASEKARYGGLVSVGSGGTFLMHDGMLLNGNAVGNGGGILVEESTASAQILGGSIVGCYASANGGSIYSYGSVTLENCSVLNGKANEGAGGNIYCRGGSLTVDNSVIASGISFSSSVGGGNIANISGTKITVTNSVIRDGFTSGYGGNLNLGYGTHKFTNTQIYGGTSNKAGANIAPNHTSASVTLDSCTVDGGVEQVVGTLTLKGSTTISAKFGGLDLSAQSSKTTTATGLTSGAEVYVSAVGNSLTGSLDYIKPAYRAILTANGTTITCAQAEDGVTAGYCPHCNQQVAWSAYGTENATHTYLTADMTAFAETSVTGNLVIDLCGYDITATGRAFSVAESGDLAILDSVGDGIITGSGVNGEAGGIFKNAGTLKLYGGKYNYAQATDVAPSGGGIVYNANDLYIYSSHLVASAFTTASGANTRGGAIYMASGETVTLTMNGGRVVGGSTSSGGSAYFDYNNNVTITGATITSGTAGIGGNICCSSNASNAALTANNKGMLTMTNASVLSGTADDTHGGNIYINRWGANITDCYLADGSATDTGGNLSLGICPSGVAATNTMMIGGRSQNRGGNYYTANNASIVASLTDCYIIDGSASSGGNLYIYNGNVTVKGGEIARGNSENSGGNIYTQTTAGITFVKNDAGVVPRILRGTAGGYGGNMYISKSATITDGFLDGGVSSSMGADIYAANSLTALTLGQGLAGDIHMDMSALKVADELGTRLDKITAATMDAQLYVGNVGVLQNGETLYAAATAVIDQNGEDTWFYNNAAAMAACDANSYIKLYTGNDLVLTKDCYVDLNGQTVNVSGAYTLYGMDSTGDNYAEPTGTANLAAETTTEAATNAPNGNRYLAVTASNAVSYHRLGMAITGISLRPSVSGIYYTAKWSCDDTLKAKITAYGTAVSVEEMPTADFANQAHCKYTVADLNDFTSGATKTSAIIANILKADAEATVNSENGKTPIYATAYITIDGVTYLSDRDGEQDDVDFSLYNVMKSLDSLIVKDPIHYRKFNLNARNFYEQWKEKGMGDWKLNKIPKPAEDDVIDVLMIGHSFCYYYVEELYNIAKAEGIKMRVCNLYYSSRGTKTHYEKWMAGVADCQLFEISDDTGGVKKSTSSMGIENALAKYEWDFIALQGGTTGAINSGAAYYDEIGYCSDALLGYFIQEFPDARIGWHQAWTNQAGEYRKKGSSMTTELQASGAEQIQIYAELVCGHFADEDGNTPIQRIPTGMAWQKCRTDTGYDYLCSRLGYDGNAAKMMHAGDGNHDGDIGGGQYLNACVWFEIITGQSVLGNTYRPSYATSSTLSDELFGKLNVQMVSGGYSLTEDFVQQLQGYAHEAVADTGFVVAPSATRTVNR